MNSKNVGIALVATLAAAGTSAVQPANDELPARTALTAVRLPQGAQVQRTNGQVTTIAGVPLAFGNSASDSAEAFLRDSAALLPVERQSLIEGSLASDNAHERTMMPLRGADLRPNGSFKFTLVSYLQTVDGIPVYNGDLRLLVRNEPGFPVVLVRSALRPMAGFRVDPAAAASPNVAAALLAATEAIPGIGDFTTPTVVVFAGDDLSRPSPPSLAVQFEGSIGNPGTVGFGKYLIVANAATGAILWTNDLIRRADVSGVVTGRATQGLNAAECGGGEASEGMPYARVSIIGSTTGFADADGQFSLAHTGTEPVTVRGSLEGEWFVVYTPTALEGTIDVSVTPPGPANIEFNPASGSNETHLAAVNAYLNVNRARDFVLSIAPDFPTVASDTGFRLNVMGAVCDAYNDGTKIVLGAHGPGCNNHAFSTIVQHEYGHRLVQLAGSGQNEYGEGFSDCLAILINDDSGLGSGFYLACTPVRDANNQCKYLTAQCSTCGAEIHACGKLLSGCVWSLRNELACTHPSTYLDIVSELTLYSVELHSGTQISSQICTDFLTLDDDDSNLGNGTPHSCQILKAFADHDLATYPGALSFSYSGGFPSFVPWWGGTVDVTVSARCYAPTSATGTIYVDEDDNGTYVASAMSELSANHYRATLPSSQCGATMRFYIEVENSYGCSVTDPPGAPAEYYVAFSGDGYDTIFEDDFETNKGWTSSIVNATTGQWDRGTPADPFGAAPPTGYGGSGQCFVTDNRVGGNVGSYDVDGGSVILTSPTIDASGGESGYVSYARWFDNRFGGDPNNDVFEVQVSNDGGSSWNALETIGPVAESDGGWRRVTRAVPAAVALTDQMRVRFIATDSGSPSVVEAAVDSFAFNVSRCYCPADYNHDGFVSGDDFDAYVAAFEAGDPSADFNHDSFVSGDDFDLFVVAFEGGC